MSALVNFEYGSRPVRVVMVDGEPWWVAKDVAEVFGDTNYRRSVGRLDDDEKGVSPLYTPGGSQNVTIVNESGLYALLFHMQPQKRATMTDEQYEERVNTLRQFKRWITHDVLPSIRKHGMYAVDDLLDNPDLLVEVATKLRDERKARLAAEAKVIELAPKAAFYDHVADADGYRDMGDVAKELGTGRNRFFDILRQMGIIMQRKPIPYQRYVDDGYFKVIETTTGPKHTHPKTVVSGKGLVYIQERIRSAGGVKTLESPLPKRANGRRKRLTSR